ncbi:Nitroreductase [Marasmius fiardii PR-910]|nr:Nitroreductase [Marasmius fiardii PR-910]
MKVLLFDGTVSIKASFNLFSFRHQIRHYLISAIMGILASEVGNGRELKNVPNTTTHDGIPLVKTLDSLMKGRFSCRYFLPKPVSRSVVEEISDAARFAPSGNNMQPWEKVYCLAGQDLKVISEAMLNASRDQPNIYTSQYRYNPPVLPPHYAERRQNAGAMIMKVEKKLQVETMYFMMHPWHLFSPIHKDLTEGSWLDVGYFIQSTTLAARARGLETVSQESISKYHSVLRKSLPIGEHEIVAVGMSIGYPDFEKVVQFPARQPKREVSDIVEFHGL